MHGVTGTEVAMLIAVAGTILTRPVDGGGDQGRGELSKAEACGVTSSTVRYWS